MVGQLCVVKKVYVVPLLLPYVFATMFLMILKCSFFFRGGQEQFAKSFISWMR